MFIIIIIIIMFIIIINNKNIDNELNWRELTMPVMMLIQ